MPTVPGVAAVAVAGCWSPVPAAPTTIEGDQADHRGSSQRRAKRLCHADLRDQIEAGGERAGDGTRGVDGVQQPMRPPTRVLHDGRLDDERQRCAHQRGGHDQDQECDDEADGGDGDGRFRQRGVNRDPQPGDCGEDVGCASAVRPTSASTTPNTASGRVNLVASRPAMKLPAARPAMNPARTVLAAYTVTPKTSASRRSHITW